MRNDFVRQMMLEMKRNRNIVFLTADLGFNALESLQKTFPDCFYNVGVAEAHMMGLAAGLALAGKKVIAYSIATFAALRPYEQIRTDICYHNLDVKIVATGGGYNYAEYGVTHHTVEDIAIMQALPGMTVVCPGYSWEAAGATQALMRQQGPAYLRLGKSPGIDYAQPRWQFTLGKGYVVRPGREVVLATAGNIIDRVMAMADVLEAKLRVPVGVVSFPTIKPLDVPLVRRLARGARGLFVVEEHGVAGGLGQAIAHVLATDSLSTKFAAFGLPDKFVKAVGQRDHLLDAAGLSVATVTRAIVQKVQSAL